MFGKSSNDQQHRTKKSRRGERNGSKRTIAVLVKEGEGLLERRHLLARQPFFHEHTGRSLWINVSGARRSGKAGGQASKLSHGIWRGGKQGGSILQCQWEKRGPGR